MDINDRKHLKRLVKADENYLKFKRSVDKNPNLRLPFEELHEELEREHKMRQVRSLHRSDKDFIGSVTDAMMQDARIRSRATEILASTIAIKGTFTDTLTNLRDYLILAYGKRLGGTKEERRNFMENILRPFFKYIHKVDQLREHARYIIEDIDKAGYTFKNLMESIKLLGKPESI